MPVFTIASDPSLEIVKRLEKYSSRLQKLLSLRGIDTEEGAHIFLNPSYEEHLHDPYLLHDMGKAVSRVLSALESGEQIAIYSDYDCDGIPGAVILHDFFKAIGYSKFINYIPHRHFEGFGFNCDAVEKLKGKGVSLIITIDCGTTDIDAVEKAQEVGIDVIVTDHHEPKAELPKAYAIVNPKIGDSYPFKHLCGSAVVFKLVQALIAEGSRKGAFALKEGWEKWWLDMVALATIADMVPLTGENRVFARYGLHVLRKGRRLGLGHLLRKQNARIEHLTEDDIGFTIGPRINAASRMDSPEDAFYMLSTNDEADAGARVAHLEKLNNERKGIVASMMKEAKKRMIKKSDANPVLVLGDPSWRPSLLGLVANKLAEEYSRPAFLWGRDGRGIIKGSCRSNGTTSVVALMDVVPHIFLEYGGHHMSGGFGVHEDHIHTFSDTLNDAYIALGEGASFANALIVDDVVTLEEVNEVILNEIALLSPYGMGNPKPLFLFKSVVPTRVEVFGKAKEHTKISFDTSGKAKEAIAFFKLPEEFQKTPVVGEKVSLYGHIEQSFFMGRHQTRIRIIDIV